MHKYLIVLCIVLYALCSPAHAQDQPASAAPIVAAASDLKFALEEIATRFRAESSRSVRLVFGSSGNFYQQIVQGAPFQVFMSADEGFVFKLAQLGKTEDRGALYAIGRIVLFAPHGSPLQLDTTLSGLSEALKNGRIRRFAIANPGHAPYGRAAEQALRQAGLWDAVKPVLVIGENVSQAAQFASSGSSQGGIFAYSLALAPALAKLGNFVLLPEPLHEPLRQRMVVVKGASDTAIAFYRYVQQPAAREIFKRYGFALPVE